ncbi:hypothetical protein C8A05DRAFT_19681 [Staphylotrichum tortipilum]|uniref:Uncharacterized protein n=1 Tax=Staphylotrichum tortipilum TaxID=2831512 RepID=A0AAN6MCN2_9PEZI|nr:hypothetical protein C8A05DRAFT_19681 [Staphylotrichum longicolle]
MASHHRQRPLSAVLPGDTWVPPYPADVHVEEPSPIVDPVGLSVTLSHKVDPRRLFADRFWGQRRYSDSAAQLPRDAVRAEARHRFVPGSDVSSESIGESSRDAVWGSSAGDRGSFGNLPVQPLSRLPESDSPPYPGTPNSALNFQQFQQPPSPAAHQQHPPPRAPSPPPRRSTRFQYLPSPSITSYTSSLSSSLTRGGGGGVGPRSFLHCPGYTPHVIHPRDPFTLPSRRDDFFDALGKIEGMAGPVSVKGVGHLAKPAFGKSPVTTSKLLSHFLHRAKRTLLVPDGSASSREKAPSQRELARLESELFDTSKYVGGSSNSKSRGSNRGKGPSSGTPSTSNHLTVLTWSSDDAYGTITLFEADLSPPASGPFRRRTTTTSTIGLGLPLPSGSSSPNGGHRVVHALRPVTAMEDVPRQVLVNMRVDAGVKKVVLQHDPARGRFRWTAQHTRRGGAVRQARVWVQGETREVGDADWDDDGASLDSVTDDSGSSQGGWGRRRSRRGGRTLTRTLHAAPGVVATIPQFLALTHASRATLDEVTSLPASSGTVATEDGERVRVVSLGAQQRNMKGARHKGRDVHVVVLVPDGARWAEEKIFWTDGVDGLAEMRQKKYGDVVLPAKGGRGMRGAVGRGGEEKRRDINAWERREGTERGVKKRMGSPGGRKLEWSGSIF